MFWNIFFFVASCFKTRLNCFFHLDNFIPGYFCYRDSIGFEFSEIGFSNIKIGANKPLVGIHRTNLADNSDGDCDSDCKFHYVLRDVFGNQMLISKIEKMLWKRETSFYTSPVTRKRPQSVIKMRPLEGLSRVQARVSAKWTAENEKPNKPLFQHSFLSSKKLKFRRIWQKIEFFFYFWAYFHVSFYMPFLLLCFTVKITLQWKLRLFRSP